MPLISRALAASACFASAVLAQDQREPYPATLMFGTGLINIPVAWISPNNADVWLNTSAKLITGSENADLPFGQEWNTNASIETHWLNRFSVGASVYNNNVDWGVFGQVLLLRDNEVSVLPAVAVGVRNLGHYPHEDRFLIGHDISCSPGGCTRQVPGPYDAFDTSPTFYAVATKEFGFSGVEASATVGWGNGLFTEDGDLGELYNSSGQLAEGLFLGARAVARVGDNAAITFLAENDGWDWNVGAVGNWRGITLGVYVTELEEGGKDSGPLQGIYNYTKFNVALGFSSNIRGISQGNLLRARAGELEREARRLRTEIAQREGRIRELEASLGRAQEGELAEVARRREQLLRQLEEEREAIRRAEERLRQLEQQRPPNPPPGGTTPPQP
ncbi:MAG: hypothetical protein ACREON_01090 [Gemmatimonadaceae bacterium]